jgi:hypothetical protein
MLFQPFRLHRVLGQLAEWLRSRSSPAESREDLRRCLCCKQPFVGPLVCRVDGRSHRRILLRCGNCECRREVVVTNEQASAFECDVARDIIAITRALERLDSERLHAQADAFAAALAHDLIDASDFS